MKKLMVSAVLVIFLSLNSKSQSVGIGTTSPDVQAILHIDVGASTTRGLLITGSAFTGTVPDLGGGSRLMYFPGKAAFRAGYVGTTQWNNINTGYASAAMGEGTTASGDHAFAMGLNSVASGSYSFAAGNGSTASATSSSALGLGSTAGGLYSFADGFICTASGQSSIAMGSQAIASGDFSVAIGDNISTNGKKGSFFFADSDPYNRGQRVIGSLDQMACRFNGGYYFISSNSGADIGVQVVAGSNSWSVISDVRLKEKFLPVDGEDCLEKISKLPLTTWNYRGQDAKHFRHYGPMAQDFYASFGNDEFGTIGCDTLINQQDLIGVNLVAIQALERRTETLKAENGSLKGEVTGLQNEVALLKERLDKMEKAGK